MEADYKCPKCGKHYSSKDFKFKVAKCPQCKKWLDFIGYETGTTITVEHAEKSFEVENSSHAEATLRDLVAAQNRTTSAVRSLALFFFYNLLWGSAVAMLVLLASLVPADKECTLLGCTSKANPLSGFILFIAFVIGVIGIFVTMSASIKELRASRNSDSFM